MLDLRKYQKRKENVLYYCRKIEVLNHNLAEVQSKYSSYCDTCTHDLVVNFGKEGPYEPDTGYSLCVCCGKPFKLKEDLDDVNPDNVINLVGAVPETYFYTYRGNDKILMTRIKDKMNLIVQEGDSISMDVLKQILIEDLIAFTEQHQKENEERLVRVRETKIGAKHEI